MQILSLAEDVEVTDRLDEKTLEEAQENYDYIVRAGFRYCAGGNNGNRRYEIFRKRNIQYKGIEGSPETW